MPKSGLSQGVSLLGAAMSPLLCLSLGEAASQRGAAAQCGDAGAPEGLPTR